ncbi:hypothetical protein [Amycolatopsis sp. cmx-4-68]|uniref:hypothetical protein n=1 Tax=Amycolatopsis sp. cmx-4-68 TaxID=2790938 RepID=UPI00397C2184
MPETTDNLPTSWPDWVQITTQPQDVTGLPADAVERLVWEAQYDGLCHSCSGTTEGDRAAVIRWAQNHADCEQPAAPEPILRQPDAPVGRIEDLPRNPDGSVTIPTAGVWTFGHPA